MITKGNTQENICTFAASRNHSLDIEKNAIANLPVKIFGYYALQLGGKTKVDLLNVTSVRKQICLHEEAKYLSWDLDYSVLSDFCELPFFPSSIDFVAIFHALETSKKPQQILREVYDVLVPEGYVVIFTFNPFSLMGIFGFLNFKSSKVPSYHFLCKKQLIRWFNDLGFAVINYETMSFRPPIKNKKKLKKLLFLEGLGQMFAPNFGNISMYLVQKKTITLTKVKQKFWQKFLPTFADTYAKTM